MNFGLFNRIYQPLFRTKGIITMPKHNRLLASVIALSCAALLAYASPTAARPMIQYTNPYSGATWNNSFSRIMDMTRTWNQNLWDAQRRVQSVTDQTAAMGNKQAGVAASQLPPSMRQYLIGEV